MTPPRTDTKELILRSAYSLFYSQGFARVSVEAIAKAADVTKRTVYYHFKSKDDIVSAVLNFQHSFILQRIQKWAENSSDTPLGLIENLFDQLTHWASQPNWLGSGFTRITMELADLPGHPARSAASHHKAAVELWLEQQFADTALKDPKQIARQIMVLIEGSMCLVLIHGDPVYVTAAAQTARMLVTRQAP